MAIVINPFAFGGAPPSWTDAMTALAPYSWYKMDETSGTTLTDSGSTPVNGVTAASNITHNQASIIPGNTSGKSKITANGGQIDTGSISTNGTTGYTIVFTYKGTSSNVVGNGLIFSAGAAVRVTATLIEMRDFGSGTSVNLSLGTRDALITGSAVLCVMVCKDVDQRFYINGTLNGSQALDVAIPPSGNNVCRFARSGGSDYLSGQYDDIAFIAGALTGDQVSTLYASWAAAAA